MFGSLLCRLVGHKTVVVSTDEADGEYQAKSESGEVVTVQYRYKFPTKKECLRCGEQFHTWFALEDFQVVEPGDPDHPRR